MSRAGGQAGQGGRGRRARDFTKPCPSGGRASVHAEALLPRLWSESSLVWHTVCGCVSCAPPPQRESDIAKASRRGERYTVCGCVSCAPPPQRESDIAKASRLGESLHHVMTNALSQSSEDAWS